MAKLKAPFFSLEARGAFADAIVINTVGGQTIARRLRRHADARSPAQLEQRSLFAGAIEYWHTLTPAEKQVYHDINPQIGANPAYLNFIRSWLMGTVPTHGDEHGKAEGDPIGTELEEATHPTTVYTLPFAHTRPLLGYPHIGYYIPPSNCAGRMNYYTNFGANTMKAVPFLIASGLVADRIALEVQTAGAGLARLGIYTDLHGVPHELVLDAGTVDVSATGLKTISINQALTPGLYWLVSLSNVTFKPFKTIDYEKLLPYMGHDVKLREHFGLWYRNFVYAPLPDPFGAVQGGLYYTYAIGLRFSS